jgi:metal-responsive CopG/Arc/MetJ family transcriptional regulator
MKSIQVTLDEQLLMELDESEDVKRDGRSAVIRCAVREYLRRRRRRSVAEQYRRAYAGSNELGVELEGWEEEGQWPLD